jgi:hypothetical protein
LTDDQLQAIQHATTPSAQNPFVTRTGLPNIIDLPAEQRAALNAAHQPGATNPFVTQMDLPLPQLNEAQRARR